MASSVTRPSVYRRDLLGIARNSAETPTLPGQPESPETSGDKNNMLVAVPYTRNNKSLAQLVAVLSLSFTHSYLNKQMHLRHSYQDMLPYCILSGNSLLLYRQR